MLYSIDTLKISQFKKWVLSYIQVLRAEWWCPLLDMVVKLGMQCCPLVGIGVELCIRSILMGRYLNSAIRLVFLIKLIIPKLFVSPTGLLATLIRMTKLVTLLYTIKTGHYDSWAFSRPKKICS